jgi:hypothetical protein
MVSHTVIIIFFFTGDHLEVCPQGDGYTCCTRDMEIKLRELSAKEYDSLVDQSFRYVQSTFVSRTRKFDGKFATMQLGEIYFLNLCWVLLTVSRTQTQMATMSPGGG